jgi:HSP20 family protein
VLLTSIDPFVQEFDRLAQRVFGTPDEGSLSRQSVMPMDGIRRKDDVLLRFDLPGADPDSIEVTVDRGVLTVSARRAEVYAEGESPFIRERVMGSFTRRVYLAETLDSEKIDAAYANGVLAVRLPLLEKARPRKVEIHTDGKSQKKITA